MSEFGFGLGAALTRRLLLVLWTAVLVAGLDHHTPSFSIDSEIRFSKGRLFYKFLRLDEASSSLYVGAMNSLYKLPMFNIGDTSNLTFYSEKDFQPSSDALATCSYRTTDQEFHCQNHVRVVAKLPENMLYVCGTNALKPVLMKVQASTLAVVESNANANAICPVDPNDNATALWVASGNPDGIPSIYAGTDTDYTKTSRVIYRPPLSDDQGERHPFMRTMHTDSKWLNEPQFVGSFENGDYVYFFFREVAVEHMNCGKTVFSRVARLCKSDTGGQNVLRQTWATFLKARLNCSLAGEFPFYFDEIQDIVEVKDGGANSDSTIFYATFTTSLNGFHGSAVCAFRLSDIDAIFDQGLFKEQATSSSAWLPATPSQVPHPRPGQCSDKPLTDTALHFIKTHTLMDGSVSSLSSSPSEISGPLFYKKDVILSKLTVDRVRSGGKSFYMIFAASVRGEIYKIAHWFNNENKPESNTLAVYKLPIAEPVQAMQLLPQEFVYVAQDATVTQVRVGQCGRYKLCKSCASDPYCSWNSMRSICDRAQDSHHFAAGWIRLSPDQPNQPMCMHKEKQITKRLYPGDSVHLECSHAASNQAPSTYWLRDGQRLDTSTGRHLLTVDGGLVIANISVGDAGRYECMEHSQVNIVYNLSVDSVNCQKPHNIQAFQSVYRDWCREFQEYKHTMFKWKQWQEENQQCSGGNSKKPPNGKVFDNKSLPTKSNRFLNRER